MLSKYFNLWTEILLKLLLLCTLFKLRTLNYQPYTYLLEFKIWACINCAAMYLMELTNAPSITCQKSFELQALKYKPYYFILHFKVRRTIQLRGCHSKVYSSIQNKLYNILSNLLLKKSFNRCTIHWIIRINHLLDRNSILSLSDLYG